MRDSPGSALPERTDSSDKQILFEGAVLAVLARVLDSGNRIDLAVDEYLASFPIDGEGNHVRPDMIICASDCLSLLLRDQPDKAAARLRLDDATRLWRDTRVLERVESHRGATRVQSCIGNIRRAFAAFGALSA